MNNYILQTKNASKIFGMFRAVDNVDFQIQENDAVGIIGPNGAGKTTFINILTGNYIPDEGEIFFNGNNITDMKIEKRVEEGIIRTYQLVHVFENLSVYDNLALSYYRKIKNSSFPKDMFFTDFFRNKKIGKKIIETLEVFSMTDSRDQIVSNLSLGNQKKLEIAMAWITDPQIFILDEPFAGISDHEIDSIVEILKKLKGLKTLIIVEHKLSKLTEIVDTLCVMNEGQMIASGPCEETLNSPEVRKSYWKIDDDGE